MQFEKNHAEICKGFNQITVCTVESLTVQKFINYLNANATEVINLNNRFLEYENNFYMLKEYILEELHTGKKLRFYVSERLGRIFYVTTYEIVELLDKEG